MEAGEGEGVPPFLHHAQAGGGAGKEEPLGLTWLSLIILRQVEVYPRCEGLNRGG